MGDVLPREQLALPSAVAGGVPDVPEAVVDPCLAGCPVVQEISPDDVIEVVVGIIRAQCPGEVRQDQCGHDDVQQPYEQSEPHQAVFHAVVPCGFGSSVDECLAGPVLVDLRVFLSGSAGYTHP